MPDERQPSLFDLDGERPRTIQERFERLLEEDPGFFRQFCELALELKRRGFKRYSADGLLHILRWERLTGGGDQGGWRVNNVFSSRLARKAMAEVQELAGFFELRRLKAE